MTLLDAHCYLDAVRRERSCSLVNVCQACFRVRWQRSGLAQKQRHAIFKSGLGCKLTVGRRWKAQQQNVSDQTARFHLAQYVFKSMSAQAPLTECEIEHPISNF